MKRWFLSFAFVLIAAAAMAQTKQIIRGSVFDSQHRPLQGVSVIIEESGESTTTAKDGSFTLTASRIDRNIRAVLPGYFVQSLEIDCNYIVFNLKKDKDYSSLLASENIYNAIKLAEDISSGKTSVQIDELSRLAAELARHNSYSANQISLEKRKIKEGKKAAYRETVVNFDSKFRNRGLIHTIEMSYGYQFMTGTASYVNAGVRNYGDRIPLQASYAIGYSFGYLGSLSFGIGVLYDVRKTLLSGDQLLPGHGEFKEKNVDIPIFLNGKMYFTPTRVQPMISVSGGIYALSATPLLDAGLGVNVKMDHRSSVYLLANFSFTPWPFLGPLTYSTDPDGWNYRYVKAPTLGVKLGFTF